ncbi:MAG: AraC family transcriptional regulator [Eisenbergiella sp.]
MNNFTKIGEALKYIDGHLDEKINLESLSERFYFSPYYFHRLFTAVVGKSLAAYIRDRRILFACRQLSTTVNTVRLPLTAVFIPHRHFQELSVIYREFRPVNTGNRDISLI